MGGWDSNKRYTGKIRSGGVKDRKSASPPNHGHLPMNRHGLQQGAWILPVLLLAALAGPGAGCEREQETPQAEESGARNIAWKLASAFSSTLPYMGEAGIAFTERLEEVTSGRIKMEFHDPGTLVQALEIFSAVREGQVDAGWASAGFWFEKIPAAAYFSGIPFGPDTVEYLAWIYEGGGLKLWRDLYRQHNVYPIPCGVVPPESSGWFRQEINSPEQLQGKKIHFTGLGGRVLTRMGATVVQLAAGDLYAALERGILDGTEFSNPLIDRKVGFSKVAKFYYFPGWHQQSSLLELIVNLERWSGLAPVDRALIQVVCQSLIVTGLAAGEADQGSALKGIRQDGVKILYWSEAMLQGFKKAYQEVRQEMRAKDEDFRNIDDSYQKFRRSYAEWNKLSRLPRGF